MSLPDNSKAVEPTGKFTQPWLNWASDIDRFVTAAKLSGPTANRPTDYLYIGRPYFDTSLGYQINLKSVMPNIWVNAMGAPV